MRGRAGAGIESRAPFLVPAPSAVPFPELGVLLPPQGPTSRRKPQACDPDPAPVPMDMADSDGGNLEEIAA